MDDDGDLDFETYEHEPFGGRQQTEDKVDNNDDFSSNMDNQIQRNSSIHENFINTDINENPQDNENDQENPLKVETIKSSFNLQKIIKENNKSCQRWDNFNFGDEDDSSNKDSEGNQGVMILDDDESPAEMI